MTSLAIKCRSLAYDHDRHRTFATSAGLSIATVYFELLLKITGLSISAEIVSQSCSASGNRVLQHELDGSDKRVVPVCSNTTRGAARMNTGKEQGFAGVNVADADDDFCVHDELLDGHSTAA